MDDATNLPAEIATYTDDTEPTVRGPWTVQTIGDADWAMQRLAECEEEIAELDRQAEAAQALIAHRLETLKERAARGSAFFRYKLTEWAESHQGELLHGKKRSRDLLHGRVAWRSRAERLVVTDREALAAWLAAQPVESGLYRIRVEPEIKALQELFRAHGDIPPGMDLEPASESLHIEPAPMPALVKGKP
jgi:phage host-nuclease inhibitor protein Gam